MFHGAESFNQPLDNWDVSNVIDLSYMFCWSKCLNIQENKKMLHGILKMNH